MAQDRARALERVVEAQAKQIAAADALAGSRKAFVEALTLDLSRAERAVLRAPGRQKRAFRIGVGIGVAAVLVAKR